MDEIERFAASQSEDGRYRLLVDAVKDYAIYMLDPAGIITSWNSGAERLTGCRAAEVLGTHFSRFYIEADRHAGRPEADLHAAKKTGKFDSEGLRTRKDGSSFWADVQIDPIWSHTADLVGFAKVTHDLSERERARLSLTRSEDQFRLLVQGVTDYAIFMLDPYGRITNWNSGAQRIKGYLPQEIIGRHFSAFYTQEDIDRGEPRRALETAAREGRFEQEGWRVRKDGGEFWANVVIDAIRDDKGVLLGFAKVTRDISERRQAHIALQETRQQLLQTQKMEALGQLSGAVAHDFNNLLTAILGSLDMLRKQVEREPAVMPHVDVAIWGAERAAALTSRLLAFSRKQDPTLTAIDLPGVVRSMDGLLRRSLGASVRLEVFLPARLPPVVADANQVELALLNLVLNARDAMPNGGVVTIEARPVTMDAVRGVPASRDCLCLSVNDTGEGMDGVTLSRATEPFFTTKPPGSGSGLGLSMVQELAEQLGGQLILHSTRGFGTTAELWLPTAAPFIAAAASGEEPRAFAETPPLAIVVVDDDALVLMTTCSLLQDLGHRVFDARSACEALAIIEREQSVSLVITDYSMPEMDGVALARAITASHPDLPVIVATGYPTLPAAAELDGPKLVKPFRQDELARAIAVAVASGGQRARLAEVVN